MVSDKIEKLTNTLKSCYDDVIHYLKKKKLEPFVILGSPF